MPFNTQTSSLPEYEPPSGDRRPQLEPGKYTCIIVGVNEPNQDKNGKMWVTIDFEQVTVNGQPGHGTRLWIPWKVDGSAPVDNWQGAGRWKEFLKAIEAPEKEAMQVEEFLGLPIRLEVTKGKRGGYFVGKLETVDAKQSENAINYSVVHYPNGIRF